MNTTPEDAPGTPVPFGGADAEAVKRSTATARAELSRAVADLERRQAEAKADLERRRAELEDDMRRQRAEMEAQMAPLRKQLAQLQEAAWTVDLYLGRSEDLRLIRDGKPAPEDTPITIRQKVLVMAEESLVLMDNKVTGMTADDIPLFIDWLTSEPDHLDRLLPEPRGVVVMIPTRVESRSGNIYEDAAKDAANKTSWWLLRNGERLYLLTVDPDLKVTQRVLPRRDEFTEVFDRGLFGFGRRNGEPVKPGSEEWLKMEEIADARRRHFMRIMLVLQGIIDRTPAWHPLPPGGVNLLSLADQDAGKIVLLQDDEESIQLGDGRESFADWQRRLNNLLRPGLRVIGDWRSRDFRDLEDRDYHQGHPRLHPPRVSSLPQSNVPHLIEDRRDGGFVIRYKRTDSVYRRDVPVPDKPGYVYRGEYPTEPTQRASCVIHPSDGWVLPYDLVTVADLEYYLNSREERSKHFLSMVPTVKAALAAKKAEAEQEAPFRDLLERVLIDQGAAIEDAPALVDDLVQWWKIANTWSRPLNGEPEHEAKAIRDITREYQARTEHTADQTLVEKMVATGRTVPGVICVARNRQGKWHAYAPSQPAHDEGVFLDITPIRRDGTLGSARQWVRLQQRSASLLHVAWSAPEWGTWRFSANPKHYLTGPERAALTEDALTHVVGLPICVTEVHNPAAPEFRMLVTYEWVTDTPEGAPTVPVSDPLDWRNNDPDGPVVAKGWLVEKDKDGVRLHPVLDPRDAPLSYPSDFSHYAGGSPWGNTPWWPEDATRYSDAASRPRLVWADESMLDRLTVYRERCAAAADARAEERQRIERDAYRYVSVIERLINDEMIAKAKADFIEDFGADALDLWPAHLESMGLRSPVHPRVLWGIIAIAQMHDEPVVGESIGALAKRAWDEHSNKAPGEWHPGSGPVDLNGFEHIVVPEPDED